MTIEVKRFKRRSFLFCRRRAASIKSFPGGLKAFSFINGTFERPGSINQLAAGPKNSENLEFTIRLLGAKVEYVSGTKIRPRIVKMK